MKIAEIKALYDAGMISVDDDNLDYVVEFLIAHGFKVEK